MGTWEHYYISLVLLVNLDINNNFCIFSFLTVLYFVSFVVLSIILHTYMTDSYTTHTYVLIKGIIIRYLSNILMRESKLKKVMPNSQIKKFDIEF